MSDYPIHHDEGWPPIMSMKIATEPDVCYEYPPWLWVNVPIDGRQERGCGGQTVSWIGGHQRQKQSQQG